MRIKELDDILKLVDAMPDRKQMRCVQALAKLVYEWEGQVAAGLEDDDRAWVHVRWEQVQGDFERAIEKRKGRTKRPL